MSKPTRPASPQDHAETVRRMIEAGERLEAVIDLLGDVMKRPGAFCDLGEMTDRITRQKTRLSYVIINHCQRHDVRLTATPRTRREVARGH